MNIKIKELLCCCLLISHLSASPVSYSYPSNMRSARVSLISSSMTSTATQFIPVTFATDLPALTYDIAWSISGLHMIPGLNMNFNLLANLLTASGFRFAWTKGESSSTLNEVNAMYIAWDKETYLSLGYESALTWNPTPCSLRSGFVDKTFTSNMDFNNPAKLGESRSYTISKYESRNNNQYNQIKVYYFLVALVSTSSAQYLEMNVKKQYYGTGSSRIDYYITVTIGPEMLISYVKFCALAVDATENFLFRSRYIIEGSVTYSFGIPDSALPQFNSQTAYIIGLKSFTTRDNIEWRFDLVNDPGSDIEFSSSSFANSISYLGLSEMSCGAGGHINREKKTCFWERNGCSQFFQLIETNSTKIREMIIHKDNSLVAVNEFYQVSFYKYNSSALEFSLFYKIIIFSPGTMRIADIDLSQDFSKLAVSGFDFLYVYGWNGADYALLYSYTDFTFHDVFQVVSLSQDGNRILASKYYKQFVLTYDPDLDTYVETSGIVRNGIILHFFMNDSTSFFWIGSGQYAEYQDISGEGNYQIKYQGSSVSVAAAATSSNLNVIATYETVTYNDLNGIRIFQYNFTIEQYVEFQVIQNHYTYFTEGNVSLNADGTILAVKHYTIKSNHQFIYRRASIFEYFQLDQILDTKQATSTQNYGIAVSQDGKLIVGTESTSHLVFYYCHNDIGPDHTIPTVTRIPTQPPTISPNITESPSAKEEAKEEDNDDSMLTVIVVVVLFETIALLAIGFIFFFKYLRERGNATVSHESQGFRGNQSLSLMSRNQNNRMVTEQEIVEDHFFKEEEKKGKDEKELVEHESKMGINLKEEAKLEEKE